MIIDFKAIYNKVFKSWHGKSYAWCPMQLTNGTWIWLDHYVWLKEEVTQEVFDAAGEHYMTVTRGEVYRYQLSSLLAGTEADLKTSYSLAAIRRIHAEN